MDKDYNKHFNSSAYDHDKEKERSRKRRKSSFYKTHKLMSSVKYNDVYRIVNEIPEKQIIKKTIIPAHYEEEIYLVCLKGEEYWYTDNEGINHYTDKYVWKKTGRLIYIPEKCQKFKKIISYKNIKPYLTKDNISGRRTFAKKQTNKRIRSKQYNLLGNNPSAYRKAFDYAWEVW